MIYTVDRVLKNYGNYGIAEYVISNFPSLIDNIEICFRQNYNLYVKLGNSELGNYEFNESMNILMNIKRIVILLQSKNTLLQFYLHKVEKDDDFHLLLSKGLDESFDVVLPVSNILLYNSKEKFPEINSVTIKLDTMINECKDEVRETLQRISLERENIRNLNIPKPNRNFLLHVHNDGGEDVK